MIVAGRAVTDVEWPPLDSCFEDDGSFAFVLQSDADDGCYQAVSAEESGVDPEEGGEWCEVIATASLRALNFLRAAKSTKHRAAKNGAANRKQKCTPDATGSRQREEPPLLQTWPQGACRWQVGRLMTKPLWGTRPWTLGSR